MRDQLPRATAVGTEGKQLASRRRALAVRERKTRAPARDELIIGSDGGGNRREAARDRRVAYLELFTTVFAEFLRDLSYGLVRVGMQPAEIDPEAAFEADRALFERLQSEQPKILFSAVRQIFLVAAD